LIKSELLPYLPEGLHISKGEVIKDNNSSGDCDLIIYKKLVLFQYGSVAIVPYTNAKAIIEIEDKLGIKIFTLSKYDGEIMEGELQKIIEAIKDLKD